MKLTRRDFMNSNGVVVPEVTVYAILGLFDKYRPLSNFHLAPVTVDGRTYRCSEAAYMAEKTNVAEEKFQLTMMDGPTAKKFGQTVHLRSDWESVKVEAMRKVLYQKFFQNDFLNQLLLETFPKHLEETNWWGDTFWGVCGGVGQNQLGLALVWVRDQLMRADSV